MNDQSELFKNIKSRLSLSSIIRPVVELKGRGDSFIGLCPFHQEKTPSFHVRDRVGRFKCFGCGASGDIFEFIMRLRGIAFNDAVFELALKAGLAVTPRHEQKAERTKPNIGPLLGQKVAQDFFVSQLRDKEMGLVARQYLRGERGLDERMIQQAALGFGGKSAQNFIGYLERRGVSKNMAINAGLLKPTKHGYTPPFLSRITFPIRDNSGEIVAFGARSLPADDDQPKYVNTHSYAHYEKRKSFYGFFESKAAILKGAVPILVEGYFDAMAIWALGMPALALCGTALSSDHVNLLHGLTSRVKICFDNDEAGLLALKKATAAFLAKDMNPGLIILSNKDPGDYLCHNKLSDLNALISQPIDALTYLIERAVIASNGNIHERLRQMEELIPIFASIKRPLVRRQYVALYAHKLHDDAGILWQEIERQIKKKKVKSLPKNDGPLDLSKLITAEVRVLFEMVLADHSLLNEMEDVLKETPEAIKTAIELVANLMVHSEGRLDLAHIKSSLTKASFAYWPMIQEVLLNRMAISKEEAALLLNGMKAKIKQKDTKERLKSKRQELQALEKSGDFSLVLKNLEEQSKILMASKKKQALVSPLPTHDGNRNAGKPIAKVDVGEIAHDINGLAAASFFDGEEEDWI